MIQKYLLSKAKEIQMVLFGSVTNGTYFYSIFKIQYFNLSA